LAFALLALAIRVVAPPGTMFGERADGRGVTIVLCTGHGPVTIDDPYAPKNDKTDNKSQSPCAFSAGAAPPVPESASLPAYTLVAFAAAPIRAALDLVPGRGLAAPPPPSIGPPARV
jgi:hypothetical protein